MMTPKNPVCGYQKPDESVVHGPSDVTTLHSLTLFSDSVIY